MYARKGLAATTAGQTDAHRRRVEASSLGCSLSLGLDPAQSFTAIAAPILWGTTHEQTDVDYDAVTGILTFRRAGTFVVNGFLAVIAGALLDLVTLNARLIRADGTEALVTLLQEELHTRASGPPTPVRQFGSNGRFAAGDQIQFQLACNPTRSCQGLVGVVGTG